MNKFIKKVLNAVLPDPLPNEQDDENELFLNTTTTESADASPYALPNSENWHWHSDND